MIFQSGVGKVCDTTATKVPCYTNNKQRFDIGAAEWRERVEAGGWRMEDGGQR